mgnify:CR=1 FL=1|jgi:methionyl-tRNA formyltransferase
MKLRVGIITSFERGVASHHLEYIAKKVPEHYEIYAVIWVRNPPKKNNRFWRRKIKKFFKIGVLGTLNGIRMRPWFNKDVDNLLEIKSIQHVCQKNSIPIWKVDQLNSDETRTKLKELNLDLVLSLGNGFIASSVFSIPKFGMINVHHEILPKYRNAQSVIWQLHQKSAHTGYTIHKINRTIDSGAVLYQESIPIQFRSSLSSTVTNSIAFVWNASAHGLHCLLSHWGDTEPLHLDETPGHFTTPTAMQFLKIHRNWRKLMRVESTKKSGLPRAN